MIEYQNVIFFFYIMIVLGNIKFHTGNILQLQEVDQFFFFTIFSINKTLHHCEMLFDL